MDQRALAGLVSTGKVRTQEVRVAAWGEVLKEASWGGDVDQRRGRDEGRSMWMLDQERSRAKETANARSLRGPVLGAFDEDGLWGLGHRNGGKGGGRVDREAMMRWLNCILHVMGAIGFISELPRLCPDWCMRKRRWGRRRGRNREVRRD